MTNLEKIISKTPKIRENAERIVKGTASWLKGLYARLEALNNDLKASTEFVRKVSELKNIKIAYDLNLIYFSEHKDEELDYKEGMSLQSEHLEAAKSIIEELAGREYLTRSQKLILERRVKSTYEPMLNDFKKLFGQTVKLDKYKLSDNAVKKIMGHGVYF